MDRSIILFWESLNGLGDSVEREAEKIPSITDKQIVAACYFRKLHNTIRSIMILLDNKLVFDSQVLARTLFETMIYLKALANNEPEFTERYLKDWVARRSATYKDMKGRAEGLSDEEEKQRQLKLLETGHALTQRVAGTLPPEITKERYGLKVGELAEKFKLGEQYILFYQHLHDVTHSLPPAVVPHYKRESGFTSYPAGNDPDLKALSALWIFMFSIEDMIALFDLAGLNDGFDIIKNEWEVIQKAYGERVEKEGYKSLGAP